MIGKEPNFVRSGVFCEYEGGNELKIIFQLIDPNQGSKYKGAKGDLPPNFTK